jgi:K+-sensing histidine kinase KdpD
MRDSRRLESAIGIALGGVLPILVACVLVPLRDDVSSANIALALVVTVVAAAAVGGRSAGAIAAVVSALSFDFFHTIPYLSLTIDSQDDVETTLLLLVVGLIVGTVAGQAIDARRSVRAGRHEIQRLHRIAEMVAAGEDAAPIIAATQIELTELLDLQSCRFESSPFPTVLPHLERNGTIANQREYRMTPTGFALPADGVELAVLARGQLVGRFVLVPTPGAGASLEERVVAVALADQVGGALTSSQTTGGGNGHG